MIHVVTTRGHGYTWRWFLGRSGGPLLRRVRLGDYPWLFAQRRVARGTWILCDLERLTADERQRLAGIADALEAGGARVLNHPARVLLRYALLRALRRAGLATLDAWRVDELAVPTRFPVILRRQNEHGGILGEPLADAAALEAAIGAAILAGHPRDDLLVVTWAAEPAGEGVFRKRGVFRIGERQVARHVETLGHWMIRSWGPESSEPRHLDAERRFIEERPDEAALWPIFASCGAEFGRLDYARVDDGLAVYEMNTNPILEAVQAWPDLDRERILGLVMPQMLSAFEALLAAGPEGGATIALPPATGRSWWWNAALSVAQHPAVQPLLLQHRNRRDRRRA